MTGLASVDARITRELVSRAREGDHEAFSTLVNQRIDRLYGLAGLILRDRTGAEDAVQDALLRAWRDLPQLRDVDRFDAWLRRLVVNACHDEGRRRKRRPEAAISADHIGAVSDSVDDVARRDEIERGFRRLNADERSVIALRYYLDLSTAEAADALGIREVTLRSRLHRAIRALGSAMAADARTGALAEGEGR